MKLSQFKSWCCHLLVYPVSLPVEKIVFLLSSQWHSQCCDDLIYFTRCCYLSLCPHCPHQLADMKVTSTVAVCIALALEILVCCFKHSLQELQIVTNTNDPVMQIISLIASYSNCHCNALLEEYWQHRGHVTNTLSYINLMKVRRQFPKFSHWHPSKKLIIPYLKGSSLDTYMKRI